MSKINSSIFICITLITTIVFLTTACSTSKVKSSKAEPTQMTNATDKKPENETAIKNPLWRFQTGGGISSSPICVGDAIYFGSKDGNIYSISTKTKNEIWRYKVGNPIVSQGAAYKDKIFFSSAETFYALNINTGKEIWKYDTKATDKSRMDDWDFHDSSPVIDNNVVYFGGKMGSVYGLDMLTGKVVWEFKTQPNAAVRSTPLIDEGVMYFGDWLGTYYAVDIKLKKTKWTISGYKPFQSSSAISDKTLFYGGRDTKIHAVDIATGKEKWSYLEPEASWVTGDPVIKDGLVYFSTSDAKKVYAMGISTGKVERTMNTYKGSYSKPLIYNNILCVATGDVYATPGTGKLEAFDLNSDNKCLWKVEMKNGGVFSSPVIVNDVIYYGCEDGYLYAVDLK